MTIALSVLDNTEVAIPSAVYSIVMYVLAALFGYAISRRVRHGSDTTASVSVGERAGR